MVAIDISYAQTTNMNFVAMRSAVDTVIMKAGGSNSGRYVDSKYRWFEPRARAAGMRIGHYWFNGTGDPVVDADFFVNNLSGYTPWDLLALDVESEGAMPHWNPDKALAFCNRVKQRTGRNCDVYMSSSVTRAQNWSAVVASGSKLWVAQYGSNSGVPQGSPNIAYWPTWKLWQYSSNGFVPGYAARLDVNLINESQWTGTGTVKKIRRKKMDYVYFTIPGSGIFKMRVLDGAVAGVTGLEWAGALASGAVAATVTAADYNAYLALNPPSWTPYPGSATIALTPAQITTLGSDISSKISAGATEAEVQAIVSGAVTNLAQDNINQTNAIKGFTYKAV